MVSKRTYKVARSSSDSRQHWTGGCSAGGWCTGLVGAVEEMLFQCSAQLHNILTTNTNIQILEETWCAYTNSCFQLNEIHIVLLSCNCTADKLQVVTTYWDRYSSGGTTSIWSFALWVVWETAGGSKSEVIHRGGVLEQPHVTSLE